MRGEAAKASQYSRCAGSTGEQCRCPADAERNQRRDCDDRQSRISPLSTVSALVLGPATQQPVMVDDAGIIDTSFQGFIELMNSAGAALV